MPSPLRALPLGPFAPVADGQPSAFSPLRPADIPYQGDRGAPFVSGMESSALGMTANSFASDALKAEANGDLGRAQELRALEQQYRQQAGLYAPRVQRVEDIRSVDDATNWLAGAAGQGVVSTLPPVAAGVAGAVAGAFVPPLRRFLPYMAAGIPSYQLQQEEAAARQQEDPAIAALPAQQRLQASRVTGGLQAIPDVAFPGRLVAGAARPGIRQAARRFGENVLIEGGTEGLQEAIGQQAQGVLNPQRDTSGDVMDIVNAAAAGAAGAGPFAGAGAVRDVATTPFRKLAEAAPELYEKGKTQGQKVVDLATGAVLDAADKGLDLAEEAPDAARAAGQRVVDLARAAYGKSSDVAQDVAERAKSTYVGARRSPEWRLFFGDNQSAMMGDTVEETAATLKQSARERAGIAKQMAETVLSNPNTPSWVKQQVEALGGRYDTPRAQQVVAAASAQLRGVNLAEEAGKSMKGLAKTLRGVMEATASRVKKAVTEAVGEKKQSKMGPEKGPDITQLVGYLNERLKPGIERDPTVLEAVPQLARVIRSYITNDIDEETYHSFVTDPRWNDAFTNTEKLFDIVEKARVSHSETAQEYSGTRLAENDMVRRNSFVRRSIKPEGLRELAAAKDDVNQWNGLDMYRMLGQAIDRYVMSAARAKRTDAKGEVTAAQEKKIRDEYTRTVALLGRFFDKPEAVLRFYGAKRPAGYSVYEYNKTDETAGVRRAPTSDYETADEATLKGGEEAPREEAPTTEYNFASKRRLVPFVQRQLGKAIEGMRVQYGEGDLTPVSVSQFLSESADEVLKLHELQQDSRKLSKLPVARVFANHMIKAMRNHIRTVMGRSAQWKKENAAIQQEDEAVANELKALIPQIQEALKITDLTGDAELDRLLKQVYVLKAEGGKKDFATASDTDMIAYSHLIDYAESNKANMTDDQLRAIHRTQIKVWTYSKPVLGKDGKIDPKLAESTPKRARLVSAESMYKHWKETRYRDAYEPDQVPRSAVGMAKLFFKEALASIMARPDFSHVENLTERTELDRFLWVPHRAEFGKIKFSPLNYGDLTAKRRWRGVEREALLSELRGINSKIKELEAERLATQDMKRRADIYTEVEQLYGQREAAVRDLGQQDAEDVANAKAVGYDVEAPRTELEKSLLENNELMNKFDALELHILEGELDQDQYGFVDEAVQQALVKVSQDIEKQRGRIEGLKAKPYKDKQERNAALSPQRSALTALYAERKQYYELKSLISREAFNQQLDESQYGDFEQELVKPPSREATDYDMRRRKPPAAQKPEPQGELFAKPTASKKEGGPEPRPQPEAEEPARPSFSHGPDRINTPFASVAASVLEGLTAQMQFNFDSVRREDVKSGGTNVYGEQPMWFYSRLEKMQPVDLGAKTTLENPLATLNQLMRLSRKFRVTWDLRAPEKFEPGEQFQARAKEAADLRAADADEYMARVAKLLAKSDKKNASRAQYAKVLGDAALAIGRPDLATKVQEAAKVEPAPQPTRTMSMTFAYKAGKRPEVKSGTTFDAVLAGERTGTTRFQKFGDYAMWSSRMPQKGERITIRAEDGRTATVEVTKADLYDFSQFDDKSWEKWSKQEGWTPDRGKYFAHAYGPLGIHIEFKLAETPKAEPKPSNAVSPSTASEPVTFEEDNTTGYRQRTMRNASADITLAIAADFDTAGEKLTRNSVISQDKVYSPVKYTGELASEKAVKAVVDSLNKVGKPEVELNVAGNGIYTLQALGDQAKVDAYTLDLLKRVIASPELKTKIAKIRSGGQTGFDEAGIKAARALSIPATVLAPKGWKFRNKQGYDISNEKEFKARFAAPEAKPEAKSEAPVTQKIAEFQGENRFLSNFWPAKVTYEGQEYPTVEHAYQAAKVEDAKTRAAIARLPTPAAAKKFARSVPIRSDWNKVRVSVMQDLVRQKFQNPELQKKLIETATADLQEGNRWKDTFWGVDLNTGEGKNTLGRILMKVRDEVQGKLDPDKKYSQQSGQTTRTLTQEEKDKAIAEAERHLGPKVRTLFKTLAAGIAGEHETGRTATGETFDHISVSDVLPLAVSASEVVWHESMHGLIKRLTEGGKLARKTADTLRSIATSPLMMNRLKVLLKDFPEAWEAAQKDPDEALAYMYQFWAAKHANGRRLLNIPTKATTVFQKIAKFLRELMGVVSQYEKADQLFTAFHAGRFGDMEEQGGIGPVLRTLNLSKETFSDKADRLAGPLVDVTKKIFQVAPDRLRDTGLPAAKAIADLFDPPEGKLGFNARQIMRRDRYNNLAIKLIQDYTPEEQAEALTALQRQTGNPPKGKKAEKLYNSMRALMNRLHQYQVEAGVRVLDRDEWGHPRLFEDDHGNKVTAWIPLPQRDNYWPQVWDRAAVRANPEQFVQLLTTALKKPMTLSEAHAMRDLISGSTGQIENMETDHDLGYSPFAQHVDRRVLHIDPKQVAKFRPFFNNDLMDVLSTYIHHATHRAEYARDFIGFKGENKLDLLTQQAKREGATEDELETIQKSIRAMEGSLNHEFNPELKNLYSGLITYENLALLPFMLFSSLIDPIGIGFRSGDMTEAWKALKSGMKGLWDQLRNKENKNIDWEVEFATQMGITSRLNMIDNLGVLYSGVYMSKSVRKVNDAFFRFNGMETWNQRMRSAAMAAGMRFILRHSKGMNEHSERYMMELGLDKIDKKFIREMKDGRLAIKESDFKELKVKFKDDAERQKVLAALQQSLWLFVDGAVLRPTATHRAVWMSDPAWMLVAHLKQFTYSFQRVFNRRLNNELLHGNTQALYHLAMFVPAMLVADLVRGGLTSSGAKSSWTIGDYITNSVQRSGVAGYGTFGLDTLEDAQRDNLPGASFLGPTVGHAADILQYIAGSPRESTEHLFFRSAPAGPLLKTLAGG